MDTVSIGIGMTVSDIKTFLSSHRMLLLSSSFFFMTAYM